MTDTELDIYNELLRSDWYNKRPQVIKEAIKKLPPCRAYKVKETGQKCVIYGYNSNEGDKNTKDVILHILIVDPDTNDAIRKVFGYHLEDLEVWK